MEREVTLIDTTASYGFGRSEENRRPRDCPWWAALARGDRHSGGTRKERRNRNGSRDRILREATGSLRRLRTDYIDIYQVHWTDPLVPSNRREVMSAKKILFSRRRFSPETTRSWFRFRPLRRSGITSLPCAWAKRRAAGGQYVDAPPDGAIRDGNLVTGFAWPAHPQFLALFLEVLGTRVSL